MSFRVKKLCTVLWILGLGMLAALIYHGWEGWVEKAGFPYNTFLFSPADRFADFTNLMKLARLPSPYTQLGNYPPTIYMILRFFGGWPTWEAGVLFIGLPTLALAFLLGYALQPVVRNLALTVPATLLLMGCSYPLIFCLDRANIEIVMVFLIAAALLCFSRNHYSLGLAFLVPAICFKVYPVLLTALLIRKHQTHRVLIAGVAVVAITLYSFSTFSTTISENMTLTQMSLERYTHGYIINNLGLAGTASLWNMLKVVVYSVITFIEYAFHTRILIYEQTVETAYGAYRFIYGLLAILVTLFAMFVERKFFRRVILLLLLMATSAPTGSDYRLLHVSVAMVCLMLLPMKRRHDFIALCLLAFATIPKREFIFTWLGMTDSGYADVSLGVLLNPLCIFTAMFLLIRDGFRQISSAHIRQRFIGIFQPALQFIGRAVITKKAQPARASDPAKAGKKSASRPDRRRR